jgi:hypothetical protein
MAANKWSHQRFFAGASATLLSKSTDKMSPCPYAEAKANPGHTGAQINAQTVDFIKWMPEREQNNQLIRWVRPTH